MKIKLRYCFLDRIKDIKEKLGPLKIIRNNRLLYAKFDFPLFSIIDLIINPSIIGWLCTLCLQYGLLIGAELLESVLIKIISREEPYEARAKHDLMIVLKYFRDLGVNTDYNLLLESEVYERKYRLQLNEKRLPVLLESKYIMVPSYGFNETIKETSVLQEHVVGSSNYVLSLGSPKKEFKMVPAFSHS